MKTLTGIFITLSLLISASSFTPPADEKVSSKVKSAFEKTFGASSNALWEKVNGFYVVSFKVNNQDLSAAYNENGELMSASRYINLSQLPLNITLALEEKYPGYTIDNSVTELTVEGLNSYYIKAENSKHTVTIKASSSGELSIESRNKK